MFLRTIHVAALFAGVSLGSYFLPLAIADDAPSKSAAASQPSASKFPLLDRLRSTINELNLTDEQKPKVDKAFEEAQAKIQKIRENPDADRQEMGQKLREVYTALRENIGAILTDEQREQLRTKLAQVFRGAAGAGAAGDPIARLRTAVESLELADDQKPKVRRVFEDAIGQSKDLRQQIQSGDNGARDKLRTLIGDTRDKITEILTDDQKQKLREALQQAAENGGAGARPNPKP